MSFSSAQWGRAQLFGGKVLFSDGYLSEETMIAGIVAPMAGSGATAFVLQPALVNSYSAGELTIAVVSFATSTTARTSGTQGWTKSRQLNFWRCSCGRRLLACGDRENVQIA